MAEKQCSRDYSEISKKICTRCGKEKSIEQFKLDRRTPGKRRSRCKLCESAYNRQWAQTESGKAVYARRMAKPGRREAARKRQAELRAQNGRENRRDEYIVQKQKRGTHVCWLKDKEKHLSRLEGKSLWEANAKQAWKWWIAKKASDRWIEKYWASIGQPWRNPRLSDAQKYKLQYQLDEEFAIKERLRRQMTKAKKCDGIGECIRGAIRRNYRSKTVERELGYTIAELKIHLEKQFKGRMSWDAFKAGKIHIDHILPQSQFDTSDDEQWRKCWCLSNLRPVWAAENLRKSDKRIFLL